MLQWDDDDYRDLPRVADVPVTWRDVARILGEAALLAALFAALFLLLPLAVQP